MKSGLEDRNNLGKKIMKDRSVYNVSMKSGLEDRNNIVFYNYDWELEILSQ